MCRGSRNATVAALVEGNGTHKQGIHDDSRSPNHLKCHFQDAQYRTLSRISYAHSVFLTNISLLICMATQLDKIQDARSLYFRTVLTVVH